MLAPHKILSDPKVVAEADKRKRYIKYVDAGEAEQMVKKVLSDVTPAQKAQVRKVVLGGS